MPNQALHSFANQYGNKSANLKELMLLCEQASESLKVSVPEAHFLSNEVIWQHLDVHAPNWQALYDSFKAAQGRKKNYLTDEACVKLEALRSLIMKTFNEHPLSSTDVAAYLDTVAEDLDASLMVRSTGEEDTQELANPGGNESVAAVKPGLAEVSHAVGIVVASYFSEKSLKQRLLSKDNDVTKKPFIPVLLQRMIAEPVAEHDETQVVSSGVMYTGQFETRIQIAPGHGELIVNSKAPFDTFKVSNQDLVYSEIHNKPIRLSPVEEIKEGQVKRQLISRTNSPRLQRAPAIPPAVAVRLAQMGRLIESHYGMPMDVEFIYEPKTDRIYLVQARPIPKGALSTIQPSSIAPRNMPKLRQKAAEGLVHLIPCTVITPAGYAACVIHNSSEVLVCQDLETALTQYLNQKKSRVKAVIVQRLAPTTSHEAAQFNSLGIPVVQVDDLRAVEARLRQKNAQMIVDPQRNQLIEWTQKASDPKSLIETGLFTVAVEPITLLPFDYLAPTMLQAIYKHYQDLSDTSFESENASFSYSGLLEALETLESAKRGQSNESCRKALKYIEAFFSKMATSNAAQDLQSAHKQLLQLFAYVISIGFEIEVLLARYEQANESEEKTLQEPLLQHIAKLKSLISNPGKKGVYSQSLLDLLLANNEAEKVRQLISEAGSLDPDSFAYLIEFMKLSKIALNPKIQESWVPFALFCSTQEKSRQTLAHLIKWSTEQGIKSDLLHTIFVAAHSQYPNDPQALLEAMHKNCLEVTKELNQFNLAQHQRVIQQWEEQMSEWSHPEKFDKLWPRYEKDMRLLINELTLEPKRSPLAQKSLLKTVQDLTDMMDRSIKSMKGSPEYQTKKQREALVKQFVLHLELYHELMRKWMLAIPEEQYRKWAERVLEERNYNLRDGMLSEINATFNDKKSRPAVKQLLPSGILSVASVQVGTTASFYRQFVKNKRSITLEDLFSLMHQNTLASTAYLSDNQKLIEHLPEELKQLHEELKPRNANPLRFLFSNRNRSGFSLLNMTHDYPVLCLDYNYPLRNHSAQLRVQYNQETHTAKLHFHVFGEREERMNLIAAISKEEAKQLQFSVSKEAEYNVRTKALDLVWEIPISELPAKTKALGEALCGYAQITFDEDLSAARDQFGLRMRAHWNESIDSVQAFVDALKQLDSDTLNHFLRMDGSAIRQMPFLPSIIQTASDFKQVIQALVDKKIDSMGEIFSIMRSNLSKSTLSEKDFQHFEQAVSLLTRHQCKELYEIFESEPPNNQTPRLLEIIQHQKRENKLLFFTKGVAEVVKILSPLPPFL